METEYHKAWRKRNPDKIRAYGKAARLKYPEKCRAVAKANTAAWRKKYPDKYIASKQIFKWRRFARRLLLIQEHGGHCVKCRSDNPLLLQFDHIDPSTKTKVNGVKVRQSICNGDLKRMRELAVGCQLLCANCHSLKTWYSEDYSK